MDKGNVSQSGSKKQSKDKGLKAVTSAISMRSTGSVKSSVSVTSKRSLRIKNAPTILSERHAFNRLLQQTSSVQSDAPKSAIKGTSTQEIESDDGEGHSFELIYTPDSLSSAGSYVFQKSVALPPDFFADLGEVPDLDDISSTMSEDRVPVEEVEEKKDSLFGKFVDPVTGIIRDEAEETELPEEPAEEERTPERSEDDEDLLNLILQPDTKDAELDQFQAEEEAFETFLEETRKTVVIEEEIDYEAIEKEKRELRTITAQFLDKLVTQIVEACEWIDPREVMRAQLDKEKLIPELRFALKELEEVQRTRAILNRKTVEFFRRKKAFRSITDDNPATIQRDSSRFDEALIQLDNLMGRERELQQVTESKMNQLTQDFNDVENETNSKISEFEELLRKTIGRENSEKMQMEVNKMIRQMTIMRKQLSEVRYSLILKQHTMGRLVERTNALEDLGNGLHMVDFERLQTEVQALGKKIEERNAELEKLHLRCNSDVEIMAHLREKQCMLKANVHIQKDALTILTRERYELRETLYHAKLEHSKITREIRELSFQCGLLDKPALMLDFDNTSERLDAAKANVEDLRATHVSLLQKITSLERKCQISAKSR